MKRTFSVASIAAAICFAAIAPAIAFPGGDDDDNPIVNSTCPTTNGCDPLDIGLGTLTPVAPRKSVPTFPTTDAECDTVNRIGVPSVRKRKPFIGSYINIAEIHHSNATMDPKALRKQGGRAKGDEVFITFASCKKLGAARYKVTLQTLRIPWTTAPVTIETIRQRTP